jgi:tagatose-1,6-bisphosphate aldolase
MTAARLSLMVSIEESGTAAWNGGRRSLLLPGWEPQAARNAGASAAKLLLYMRADHDATLELGVALAEAVRASCRRADLPFVLELVPFALDAEVESVYRRSFGRHVLAAARIGVQIRPDLLKLPWPASLGEEEPEPTALETLAELDVPWALLSGGAPFESFAGRVMRALDDGGACGVIAGRALWHDAVGHLDTPAALVVGARERLLRLLELIGERGRPLPIPPTPIQDTWYRKLE